MKSTKFLSAILLGAVLLCAEPPASTDAGKSSTPGFDIGAMDKSVDPCTDFYTYACGTWMKNNPIPADRAIWGRFDELAERNRTVLRNILEQSPAGTRIGDAYAACMDEKGIESKGTAPIKPALDRIAALKDKQAVLAEIAYEHSQGYRPLFGFGSTQDFKDSSQVIAEVDRGGMGMPDRDYYLKDDARSVGLRKQYQEHVARMFVLLGNKAEVAAAKAKVVMEIETELAKGALDRVKRREPANVYHRMGVAELASISPTVDWPKYFAGAGAGTVKSLNVAEPEFFRNMDKVLNACSLEDWKTYLTWHMVHAEADMLPEAFVAEDFNFYGKTLSGAKEIQPRWKRCVENVDQALGEALGREYVERTFGIKGKERTHQMVVALETALGKDIDELPWMTAETKKQAHVKLAAITNKIGYPEKWRDYSALKITRGDALGNFARARTFEYRRQLAKIGKPVDPGEWFMSPPTVNAYYDPQMNSINFPAGILQPPFYDNNMDDAVNFGGIGAVIGHELTHGFDDQGRQFDLKGNMRDWWTEQDGKEFEKRADCFVKQYGQFTAVGDVKLNGKLTLGENIADNGGLRIAYMALLQTLAGKKTEKIDGFTPEQRIFLGWAQVWCQNRTEQAARLRAILDPHSPGQWRVNGVMVNMPEFRSAFGCKVNQPMVSGNACRVW
jgi:predicted metalloendopeptidase